MLSQTTIKEFAAKWQTTTLNVAREYVQHLFLSYLYQEPESENLAFKGGTALRLLFRSPRFSEDLDFSGQVKPFHLNKLLMRTVEKLSKEQIPFETRESKTTSGGYLALYGCQVQGLDMDIELNVSLRTKSKTDPILVTSPLLPSYQCLVLPVKELVREKCEALLTRRKPRDYYDLYFLLRERVGIEAIIPLRTQLLNSVKSLDAKMVVRELKVFLPVSQHRIIANLHKVLREELNRL